MGPGYLDQALCGFEIPHDPNVIAGIGGFEDAGVYRLSETEALVQTVDFFTPIVDDPRIFGRAAAANALSDVYAMGGRPITAMNIVCFPVKKLGVPVLRAILEGGMDILREAGVALIGGHSVEDDEPKYGLAVTGLIHPGRIMTNSALKPGDKILLTKAVGTGAIATAVKAATASDVALEAMTASMCTLNAPAAAAAAQLGVIACTDVTGFGLAGHLVEMVRASHCKARIYAQSVPVLEGAADAVSMGLVPAGTYANRKFFEPWITLNSSVSAETADLMFDPQTSGGLLLAIPSSRADELLDALKSRGVEPSGVIGEVLNFDPDGALEIE